MGEITLSPEKSINFKTPTSKEKVVEPPKSPTSGAPLDKKEDGSYYDKYTDTSFKVNEEGKAIEPPKSPGSGTPLTQGEDGFYHTPYENRRYIRTKDGEMRPLISPNDGSDLVESENDSFYHSNHDGGNYIVNKETGKITTLRDPMSGGELIPNEDGTFFSKFTGKDFTFYNENFVPLYIPDDTEEAAHIENGKLVGNETGRSFEISEKGVILTPEEIEYQRISEEQSEKLATTLKDAEEEVSRSILENMASLGQSLESTIKESRLIGETSEQLDQRIKTIKEQHDKQLKIITERYYFKLDNITKVLEPESTIETKVNPTKETTPEVIIEPVQTPSAEPEPGIKL